MLNPSMIETIPLSGFDPSKTAPSIVVAWQKEANA